MEHEDHSLAWNEMLNIRQRPNWLRMDPRFAGFTKEALVDFAWPAWLCDCFAGVFADQTSIITYLFGAKLFQNRLIYKDQSSQSFQVVNSFFLVGSCCQELDMDWTSAQVLRESPREKRRGEIKKIWPDCLDHGLRCSCLQIHDRKHDTCLRG